MTSLNLDFDRVQYECFCGSYQPACYLYYCEECSKPRCSACIFEDLDSQVYCTTCLDDTNIADSRTGYCSNCYLCPICATTLSKRAVGADTHFLHCTACMWTTNDIGEAPRGKASDWVPPSNPNEARYNDINTILKDLAISCGKQSTLPQTTRATLSNLGHPAHNKYALNKALQARNRQMQKNKDIKMAEPTAEVPGLDPSIFTEEVDPSKIPTLDQDLALVNQHGIVFPIRKPLCARRQLRCPVHDRSLYRSEYSLLSTTPKNYYPPFQFCPEVKFSHEVDFSITDEFSVFLSISNWTSSALQVTIVPLQSESADSLLCQNDEPIDQLITRKDGTATDNELINLHASYNANEIGSIVFNQRHRIGVHFRCNSKPNVDPDNAHLILKLCFHRDEAPEVVFEQKVKVFILPQI
ncbi:DyNactin Complex component [Aphelenchoides bicaudatus]|nr:DyNactin Complex component [Aphelenchoides bicaudatus]